MNSEENQQVSGNGTFYSRPYGAIHTFYLSGTITAPEGYVDVIESIRNAGPNDVIQIIINSGGGDLMTGLQLREAMLKSQAHIQCVVEGQCASAATMIFLAGHELVANEFSVFMFHNYSGGTFGKGGEMHEQISFERRWSIQLMTSIYKDFLTKAEITAMLDGKDFWMTGNEVMDRITLVHDRKAKKAEASAKSKAAKAAAKQKAVQPSGE
jgi:ATP-dependent protease ClpP protease subunit